MLWVLWKLSLLEIPLDKELSGLQPSLCNAKVGTGQRTSVKYAEARRITKSGRRSALPVHRYRKEIPELLYWAV